MAIFLTRALDLEVPDQHAGFTDVDPANAHAESIEAQFASGITAGCSSKPLRFCPGEPVTRAQMTGFLVRATSRDN